MHNIKTHEPCMIPRAVCLFLIVVPLCQKGACDYARIISEILRPEHARSAVCPRNLKRRAPASGPSCIWPTPWARALAPWGTRLICPALTNLLSFRRQGEPFTFPLPEKLLSQNVVAWVLASGVARSCPSSLWPSLWPLPMPLYRIALDARRPGDGLSSRL